MPQLCCELELRCQTIALFTPTRPHFLTRTHSNTQHAHHRGALSGELLLLWVHNICLLLFRYHPFSPLSCCDQAPGFNLLGCLF